MRATCVILACLLAGCAKIQPSTDEPMVTSEDNTAARVLRRAVCIGVERTAAGLSCPGAEIDAWTAAGWMTDRRTVLLLNSAATLSAVQAVIREAVIGMGPDDLLTVLVSSHGTQRKDYDKDERDGKDEGVVLYDAVWWDDDVWSFLRSLPPCRVELITDTCHAEGNWRIWQPAANAVQLELDLGIPAGPGEAVRAGDDWQGRLVQFAGCREQAYSYGGPSGGTWTAALAATRRPGMSRAAWFDAASSAMPPNQKPAMACYGDVMAMLIGDPLQ